jgi:phytoene dehydrogenase-like protein
MNDFSTVIIGGGIAGLTCAKYLNEQGKSFLLLEASDALGGRVRTDLVDGFRLDRGFQILLTNYPEARKVLNYNDLRLRTFDSGAIIRHESDFIKMENPFRKKSAYLSMLFADIGSLGDKIKIRKLANELAEIEDEDFFEQSDSDTLTYLKNYGFSDKIIQRFFKPFYGGVFLENDLSTSSNFFQFTFKQFFRGDAAIPAEGMQRIPEQIAEYIPAGRIRKNTKVKGVEDNKIYLLDGNIITADQIVLATDARQTELFLGEKTHRKMNTTTCVYFSAEFSPLRDKGRFIALNTNRKSVVHNLCVPSDVSPEYAPAGKALISVSTQGIDKIDERNHVGRIKRELFNWFGAQVNVWKPIKMYQINDALAKYPANSPKNDLKLNENLYRCGDYLLYPSLNAAMQSGREVAAMITEL